MKRIRKWSKSRTARVKHTFFQVAINLKLLKNYSSPTISIFKRNFENLIFPYVLLKIVGLRSTLVTAVCPSMDSTPARMSIERRRIAWNRASRPQKVLSVRMWISPFPPFRRRLLPIFRQAGLNMSTPRCVVRVCDVHKIFIWRGDGVWMLAIKMFAHLSDMRPKEYSTLVFLIQTLRAVGGGTSSCFTALCWKGIWSKTQCGLKTNASFQPSQRKWRCNVDWKVLCLCSMQRCDCIFSEISFLCCTGWQSIPICQLMVCVKR